MKFLSLAYSIIKYFFACFIYKFDYNKSDTICLIGSNYGDKRSDNSRVLFQYIRSLKKHKIYFIENKPKGKYTLKRGSLKSFVYFFRSDAVFFSHSLSDILPQLHILPFLVNFNKKPIKVFIQHGVTAETGIKNVDRYITKIIATSDFIIATSDIEKELLIRLGVYKNKIKITGFPVHDKADFEKDNKVILIFFTWNKNKRNYHSKIEEILNCHELTRNIRKHHFEMIVHFHDMSWRQNFCINVDGNKVADNRSLLEVINDSGFLITDNSSVAWEFFYRERDVIFYKPSPETRTNLRHSGFHVAENINELSVIIMSVVERKLPMTNLKGFFRFKDRRNCERIYSLINEELFKQ